MRAAARYGGAPAWVQPLYECAADYLYRLELRLLDASDVPSDWSDLVVAVKAGISEARTDSAKKGGNGGARAAPMSEQRKVIEAAKARMATQQTNNG